MIFFFEASLGPYAWEGNLGGSTALESKHGYGPLRHQFSKPVEQLDAGHQRCLQKLKSPPCYLQDPVLKNLPRTVEAFLKIEGDPSISYRLPKLGATAGQVLKHANDCFSALQSKHYPMTFKFGITHDPHFRWHNEKWGYCHSFDRFEQMVVVFAAGNPHGPAFLEASLINHFQSHMALFVCFLCMVMLSSVDHGSLFVFLVRCAVGFPNILFC